MSEELKEAFIKQMLLPKEELAIQTMELLADKMELENIIKEIREYIKNLTNFQIGYGLNENDIKRTMYASENNFVKELLEILDKGGNE